MNRFKFRFWNEGYKCWESQDGWHEAVEINEMFEKLTDWGYVIQQFAGVYDRNQKEIFEGDIVRNKFNKIFKVEFHGVQFVLMSNDIPERMSEYYSDNVECGDIYNLEVIGNICENPNIIGK